MPWHEKLSVILWTATAKKWNKSFTNIQHRARAVGRGGFGKQNLSPDSYIFTSVSVDSSPPCSYLFTSATVPDTCSHYTERVEQNLSDMWHSNFEICSAQLRSVIEFAPKSLFLSVNRSPFRNGFRAGVNGVVRTHPNLVFLWHLGNNFLAITGDCKLAAPINFIRAPRPGNLTPFDSTSFP